MVQDTPAAVCERCRVSSACRESAASWFFFAIGLAATIAIRMVNLLLHLGPFWPKFSWYVGVAGFTVYFLYKVRQDRALQQELARSRISESLSAAEALSCEQIQFLQAVFCRLRSKKDTWNYFFIFFSSGLVLVWAVYLDFVKPLLDR